MGVIKPARLWVCKRCKRHGYIICRDGSRSARIGKKEAGIEEIVRLMHEKKLIVKEAERLTEHVTRSAIPDATYAFCDCRDYVPFRP